MTLDTSFSKAKSIHSVDMSGGDGGNPVVLGFAEPVSDDFREDRYPSHIGGKPVRARARFR